MNRLKLAIFTLAIAFTLAACSSGSDGPPDGGSGSNEISGMLNAAPGTVLSNVTVALCQTDSDCDVPVATTIINSGTPQAEFSFSNVPNGTYDVWAWGPEQSTTPPSRYMAFETNVRPGDYITLTLELVADDPTDGTASMTGTIYLPGSLNPADSGGAQRLVAGAEQVEPLVSEGFIPAGELDLLQTNDLNDDMPLQAVPGEVIVTFEPGVIFSQSTLGTLSVSGTQLQHVQAGGARLHLYRAADDLEVDDTLALAEQLRSDPAISTAAPNWLLHSFATPNDEFYPMQWHYEAVNMEAAWDIERGSDSVTVAIVDTGSIRHPDLSFTGGYNFISDPARAGNSSGRGSNPIDPGQGSDYHGAHVAGTVGARTNNGLGVAGVNWNVTLVPVRVLGRDGIGATFDILDGTTWAAGGSVSGVPNNPHRAHIVNLSLGASLGQSCANVLGGNDRFFQDLTRQFGTIFVVAAGNDNVNTSGVFPANCPGVITVGATGAGQGAAPYSNFGNEVDVFAPGGDLNASFRLGDQSLPYGVLSTVLQANGQPGYAFFQGTSMAAPHVAGIIALMLADEPGLNQSAVLDRLQASARRSVNKQGYSAEFVDAAAALAYTGGGGGTPPPPPEPPPTAGKVVTYLLFSRDGIPVQYAPFPNTVPGGQPYLVYGLQPGEYSVTAWQDLDNSSSPPNFFDIDPADPQDSYASVTLRPNETTTGVDFYLEGNIDD